MESIVDKAYRLVIIILLGIWPSYVLSCLWSWFIVPGFGAFPLNTITAYGILLMVKLILPPRIKDAHDNAQYPMLERFIWGIFYPAFILIIGFFVSLLTDSRFDFMVM